MVSLNIASVPSPKEQSQFCFYHQAPFLLLMDSLYLSEGISTYSESLGCFQELCWFAATRRLLLPAFVKLIKNVFQILRPTVIIWEKTKMNSTGSWMTWVSIKVYFQQSEAFWMVRDHSVLTVQFRSSCTLITGMKLVLFWIFF